MSIPTPCLGYWRRARHQTKKKSWGQAVDRLTHKFDYTIEYACRLFDHSFQAYYQKKQDEEELARRLMRIIDAVTEIRKLDPGIGYFKLWLMIKRMFQDDWVPGRDAFLKIMREFSLLQKRPKPRHTTNSNHRFHKYRNMVKGFVPTAPNQLWVSDITYIDLVGSCCYLHLVTDAYSHKIVGWNLAESLSADFTKAALVMAIENASKPDLSGLIHHSDRGVQYCCDKYVKELTDHNIQISMTEDYKPTDNAIAERVNGIIKTELLYRVPRFIDIKDARKKIGDFIRFYNNKRPHMSIGYLTPAKAYRDGGDYKKCWKKKSYLLENPVSLPQGKALCQPNQEKEQPF